MHRRPTISRTSTCSTPSAPSSARRGCARTRRPCARWSPTALVTRGELVHPRQPARAARHLRQGPPEDRRRAVGRGAPAVRSGVPGLGRARIARAAVPQGPRAARRRGRAPGHRRRRRRPSTALRERARRRRRRGGRGARAAARAGRTDRGDLRVTSSPTSRRLVAAAEAANQPNAEQSRVREPVPAPPPRAAARARARDQRARRARGDDASGPRSSRCARRPPRAASCARSRSRCSAASMPALRAPLVELDRRASRRADAGRARPPRRSSRSRTMPSRHLRAASAMLLSRFDDDAAARRAARRCSTTPSRSCARPRPRDGREEPADPRSAREGARRSRCPRPPRRGPRGLGGTTSSRAARDRSRGPRADDAAASASTGVYATLDANAAMASLTVIEKMMLLRQVPIFAELARG